MTPLTCARVVALLERRAMGLSESERLLAESHLAECASCREHSTILEGARRAASGGSDAVLSPVSRELLLKRAFELAASGPARKSPRPAPSFVQLAVAFSLIFALGLVALFLQQRRPLVLGKRADTLESGKLVSSRGGVEAGASIPANLPLSSERAPRLRVGSALVRASPRTQAT